MSKSSVTAKRVSEKPNKYSVMNRIEPQDNGSSSSGACHVYSDKNPAKAQYMGIWVNGMLIHPEINTVNKKNPTTHVVAVNGKGRNNYPPHSRIHTSEEILDSDGDIVGYRFHYA